jgi:hypothetical protein
MKKIFLTLGIFLLMVGMVSAVDCAGYFTKPADKRIKTMSSISSLELTIERLGSRADKLYNTLDDMNNDENLTYAADDFTELVNRKNDANSDFNDLKTSIDNYDNAISDSREDLPNACFKVFNLYDSDLGDMDDYFSNVRSSWNKFLPRYDIIAGYRSNLPGHLVSEAKPKVDDLKDYISDVGDEVTSNVPNTNINSTSGVTDEKIYNQTECFGMIKKNVDIATKDCQDKCNAYVASLGGGQNCPVCPTTPTNGTTCPKCQDCTSVVMKCQEDSRALQERYNALQGSCQTNCPVNNCPSTADKDAEIGRLNTDLSVANGRITAMTSDKAITDEKLKKAQSDLSAMPVCESCTLWKIGFVVLLILIILAWIVAL